MTTPSFDRCARGLSRRRGSGYADASTRVANAQVSETLMDSGAGSALVFSCRESRRGGSMQELLIATLAAFVALVASPLAVGQTSNAPAAMMATPGGTAAGDVFDRYEEAFNRH